jgi:hypothetical protein
MNEKEKVASAHKDIGTESSARKDFTTITYLFENYDIVVKLKPDGKFLGIEEVRINKDFRSYKNQTPQEIFTHVDELPLDELSSE